MSEKVMKIGKHGLEEFIKGCVVVKKSQAGMVGGDLKDVMYIRKHMISAKTVEINYMTHFPQGSYPVTYVYQVNKYDDVVDEMVLVDIVPEPLKTRF